MIKSFIDAGWSSLVARRAHNPKVVGSNPAPATIFDALLVDFFVKLETMFHSLQGKSHNSKLIY